MKTALAIEPVTLTPAEALTRLARWELAGRLADHRNCCLARIIREQAPALACATDTQVLEAFGLLCEDIALLARVETGDAQWCEVLGVDATGSDLDLQSLETARIRVACTLRSEMGVQ